MFLSVFPLSSKRFYLYFTVLILAFALFFRVSAAFTGELWLDEIWGLKASSHLKTFFSLYIAQEVFDGHSSLETYLLSFFPGNLPDWYYRLPSLLFAIGILVIIWLSTLAQERLVTILLVGFSYVMVLYGTEARGYSGMLFFLTIIFYQLKASDGNKKWSPLLVGMCSLVAFLFHYSCLPIVIISLTWCLFFCIQKRNLKGVFLLGISGLILATIALNILPRLSSGYGPRTSRVDVLFSTWALILGAPPLSLASSFQTALSLIMACASFCFSIVLLKRSSFSRLFSWTVAGPVMYLCPLLIVASSATTILFPRYFLGSILFALLIAAHSLSSKPFPRHLLIGLGTTYLILNSYLLSYLIRYGRGSYAKVLTIIERSPHSPVSVDQLFRHQFSFDWVSQRKKFPFHLLLREGLEEPFSEAPLWHINHSLNPWAFAQEEIFLYGAKYHLVDSVLSAPLSGITFHVYKLLEKPTKPL